MTAGDRIASIAAAGVLAGAIVAVGALVLNSLSGIEARLGGIQTRLDEMNAAIVEGDASLRQEIREVGESLRQEIKEVDASLRQEVADLRRRVFHVSGSAEPPSRQGGS